MVDILEPGLVKFLQRYGVTDGDQTFLARNPHRATTSGLASRSQLPAALLLANRGKQLKSWCKDLPFLRDWVRGHPDDSDLPTNVWAALSHSNANPKLHWQYHTYLVKHFPWLQGLNWETPYAKLGYGDPTYVSHPSRALWAGIPLTGTAVSHLVCSQIEVKCPQHSSRLYYNGPSH